MKNSIKITLGTILLAGIGVFTLNQSDFKNIKSTNYSPRVNSTNITAKSAAGMMEFYKKMRANVNTGQIEASDYTNAFSTVMNFNRSASRAATLQFIDEGPDNVGGRTRAILVDKNDINTVYAGSVSGGLFKSTNRGNTWSRVNAFNTTLSVSTIAQTNSGTIYVGTGAEFEGSGFSNGGTGGHRANGVWYTTDGGASFTQLSPTTSFGTAAVNQIVADPIANDKIWIGGGFPIRLTSCENKTTFNTVSNLTTTVQDVQISKDGSLLVANQGSRTYVSTDFGATFTKVSGASSTQIKEIAQSSISRIEYAIAHEKNNQGKYNIYAVQIKSGSLGILAGISISLDNGQTWTEVKPETPNSLSAADALLSDPFSGGTQWQGNFDCIIEAIPNSNNFIVGGVRLFKYEMSPSSAPNGNFFEIASNQADETSPVYVHSDIHEFHFDNTGRLYIGSDGGVSISDNISGSPTYYVANRGYNVTQFYGIGYGVDGSLIGGSQDNSCVYKDITAPATTALEFRTVSGGDGFDCEISNINPSVIFTSVQEGVIIRSPDKGTTNGGFISAEMNGLPASFYTNMRLFENANDVNSTDSVNYYAQANKLAGETVMVPSKNMSLLFPHVLSQNINVVYDSIFIVNDTLIAGTSYETGDTALIITARDTIRVQDRVQTLYATGLVGTGGVWVTRGAIRFGHTPVWWKVLDNSGPGVKSIEFSKDGNILYIGEFNGKVTRIKGFNNVYYNNEANDTINGVFDQDSVSYKYADVRSGVSQLDIQVIYNGGGGQAATGIAVDPNDPEHVVVTLGGYGGATHVIRSTTAASTTGTSSFTSIQGNLPNMPVFDAVIDVTNSNLIVVGTEFGIYASDNFGVTWTPQTTEAGIVPVFAMRQQWRPWEEAQTTSGTIYAGTHGRGIWSSSTLSGIEDNTTIDKSEEVKAISVYPNPANQYTNITFDLNERTDVGINVFNMQGKLVKTNTVKNASEGPFKKQLNIDNLTKGTYFINIKAGNGKFKTAKFIKN